MNIADQGFFIELKSHLVAALQARPDEWKRLKSSHARGVPNMQNWNDSATSMIYLANGRQLITKVTGISPEDGIGSALVQGREIKVAPLPGAFRALGYGEVIAITLQTGEVLEAILQPEGYTNHVASLSLDDSSDPTMCLFDKQSGTWREMTEQEYEQERRAWSEEMKDL